MADPHRFSDLVGPPAEPEDRPKVLNAPPVGKCQYCQAPAKRHHCERHTCRGGMYLDDEGHWRQTRQCGAPVHRWLAKAEAVEPTDEEPASAHAELGEFGERPKRMHISEWVYSGLCKGCGDTERECRERLRQRAEQGDKPESSGRRGGGSYGAR